MKSTKADTLRPLDLDPALMPPRERSPHDFGLYVLIDTVAKQRHGAVWTLGNDNVALRTFMSLCRDERAEVSRNPADYTLYRVGTVDALGNIIAETEPFFIATGQEVPKQ